MNETRLSAIFARFKAVAIFKAAVLGVLVLLALAGVWQLWSHREAPPQPTVVSAKSLQDTPNTPSAVRGKRVALLIGNANYDSAPWHWFSSIIDASI